MKIEIEKAKELFVEANLWSKGETLYLSPHSEIRSIARETFSKDFVRHMDIVCMEIFRVIAEEKMQEAVDWKSSYEQACKDADEYRQSREDQILTLCSLVGAEAEEDLEEKIRALVSSKK